VQTVYRSWVLNELLEDEVHEPASRTSGGGLRHVAGGSKPPWNSQAAHLVMDLHAKARDFEASLNYQVCGRYPVRGVSSRSTWLALYHLTDLMEAVADREVTVVLVGLRGWTGQAEVVLGQAEPVRRLPREFGQAEQVCMWCGYKTLRCYSATGSVFCVNPECFDADGEKPKATIHVDEAGGLTLLWQDGAHRIPVPIREEAA
jgi:hypothetical protein